MDLPIKILYVMFFHVLASVLLGLPPLLTSYLFFLHSVCNEFVFEVVSLVVELGVVLCDFILIIEQHLIVLGLMYVYVLVGEVFHLLGLSAEVSPIVVDLPLLHLPLLLHLLLFVLLPHQLVQLLLVEVLQHDVMTISGARLFLARVAGFEATKWR